MLTFFNYIFYSNGGRRGGGGGGGGKSNVIYVDLYRSVTDCLIDFEEILFGMIYYQYQHSFGECVQSKKSHVHFCQTQMKVRYRKFIR